MKIYVSLFCLSYLSSEIKCEDIFLYLEFYLDGVIDVGKFCFLGKVQATIPDPP